MTVPRLKTSGVAGDSRMTPQWLVDELAVRYAGGVFSLDVCASAVSAKAKRYFDVQANGLVQPWICSSFFCNPPWSAIEPWVQKGIETVHTLRHASVGVYVLPARLSSAWWQVLTSHAEVLKPIRGRVQFPPEDPSVKSSSNPEATIYAVLRRDIERP